MIFYYAAFSIIITLIPANSTQNVMKSIEKQTTRLIRSIVPKSHFTHQDLKVDEKQKILLQKARPLNVEKSIYELKGDLREESFDRKQLALVTKAKPSFIEDVPALHFLNYFFDGRIQINSLLHYPFTSICYLEATKPLSDKIIYWRGSGFLIGPNVLLDQDVGLEAGSFKLSKEFI
jgi:V8-like Glu-specific endopeptidase